MSRRHDLDGHSGVISISFPFGGVIVGNSVVFRGLALAVKLREKPRKTLLLKLVAPTGFEPVFQP